MSAFETGTGAVGATGPAGATGVTGAAPAEFSARIERTTDQTGIVTATLTAITFESERFDNGGLADLGSQATRLTVPSGGAGRYACNAQVLWDNNLTGERQIILRLNGSSFIGEASGTWTAGTPVSAAHTIWDFAAGDYVEAIVRQASGTNRSVIGSSSRRVYMAMARVGA